MCIFIISNYYIFIGNKTYKIVAVAEDRLDIELVVSKSTIPEESYFATKNNEMFITKNNEQFLVKSVWKV